MNRIVLLALLPLSLLFASFPGSDVRSQARQPVNKNAESNAARDSIRNAVEKYVAAYNSRDAKAIGALYAENAELIDARGTTYSGREKIAAEYEAFFAAHPKASLRIAVEKLSFVSPAVAIEHGSTESRLGPDQPISPSRYVSVYVKEGDRWVMASVRDESTPESLHDNLDDLTWMIGKWMDEDPESRMEIDCYWHENGSYLIRDFRIKIKGLLASSGTERIGWDPVRKQIRSWLFDADGGHLEATWIRQGDHWVVTASGFRSDGEPTHASYEVTSLRDDAFHMAASQRTAGREQLDDFEMTIVRRPPPPGNVP